MLGFAIGFLTIRRRSGNEPGSPRWGIVLFVVVCVGVVALMAGWGRGIVVQHLDLFNIAEGRALYEEHCASCHGINLEGQPKWQERMASGRLPAPPHDDSGHTWHHSDRELFEMTKFGMARYIGDDYGSDMPAYEGILSDDQIADIMLFIRSKWSLPAREYQERINRQAEQRMPDR